MELLDNKSKSKHNHDNNDSNIDNLRIVADIVVPSGLKDKVQQAMQDPQGVSIVKGCLQLPLALQTAPWLSSFMYQSSEICGEGNTKMKARTNLKRRLHN